MATLAWTVSPFAKHGGNMGTGNLLGTDAVASGKTTTSGTATNLRALGAGTDYVAQADLVFKADAIGGSVWVRFGGVAAEDGASYFIADGKSLIQGIDTTGTISVIDNT